MRGTVLFPKDGNHNPEPKTTTAMGSGLKIFLGILWIVVIYFGFKFLLQIDLLHFFHNLMMLKNLPALGKGTGFGLLFALGILTSVHCLGMCGGIILSQTLNDYAERKKERTGNWIYPSVLYNAGRVIAYTLVGAFIGGLGQVVTFIGIWKGIVPIIGGVFMIIMGMNLLKLFPFLRHLNLNLPSLAFKKIRSNRYGPFIVGILNGLMPCGPLQIVQLYALSTGSAVSGALSMFCFAMGTVPLLFSFGAVSTKLNKKHESGILKISAILVILLGLVMAGRGLALFGVITFQTEKVISADVSIASIQGNIQTVTASIQSDRFPAIVVQKDIPVRWIIKADPDKLNGCNHEILIPKFKIDKKLVTGENIVEFTPLQTGDFIYTCWMGMIKSKLTVVEDIRKLKIR